MPRRTIFVLSSGAGRILRIRVAGGGTGSGVRIALRDGFHWNAKDFAAVGTADCDARCEPFRIDELVLFCKGAKDEAGLAGNVFAQGRRFFLRKFGGSGFLRCAASGRIGVGVGVGVGFWFRAGRRWCSGFY